MIQPDMSRRLKPTGQFLPGPSCCRWLSLCEDGTVKKCTKCGRALPIGAFYTDARHRDGLGSWCKGCSAECSRRYQRAHRPERAARARRYRAAHKGQYAEQRRLYRTLHPEHCAAINAVKRALWNGGLVRPDTCELCGAKGQLHAHHHDYSRPLDVIFLCRVCHKAAHAMADSFTAAVAAA